MLLNRSLILIALLCITISMSHPMLERQQKNRPKRKTQTKNQKRKKEDADCIKGFCEKDASYPLQEVKKLLKEQHLPLFYMKQYEAPIMTRGPATSVQQEHLCDVITKTMRPKRANNGFGTKEFIVQTETAKQSIYLEVCRSDSPKLIDDLGCLPNGHNVICEQQYRLIPLWTYNESNKTLSHNQFKVPSGCTVHYTKRLYS